MATFTRRTLLKGSVVAVGSASMLGLVARAANPTPRRRGSTVEGSYGPLVQTGRELALPLGFRYVILSREGDPLSDGHPTLGFFDGMAAFAITTGAIRLVRNHEIRDCGIAFGDGTQAYDRATGSAGTTTLDVAIGSDGVPNVSRSFISLSGTHTNCSGGPTPWGSWLTCEETTVGIASIPPYAREHGYVFEVPAHADNQVVAEPLKAMGRFTHEAIAVDPRSGIVYQTEDYSAAGFYRFIPAKPGNLRAGGALQMLAVRDRPHFDARTGQQMGVILPATWVDIADPDPVNAAVDPSAVYRQGLAQGAATFSRLEGAWCADGVIYFHATDGGDVRLGQIWHYTPTGEDVGQLSLLFESPSTEVLNAPDHITVSPRGGTIICEDGGGTHAICGLTRRGDIFEFARNLVGEENTSEFAGACFSPDGQYLFVNSQNPGYTYAIWGPWERGAL